MNAIIYCRVSSRDQVEGTSLESQESACREYAVRHSFTVSRVFIEEGESAKVADRTQLLELLSYCQNKSHAVEALLVWKVDRFARNVEDHYAIKATLRKHGVNVVSVTEPIQADPNGKLLETILAGFAQFDNDIRAMRTVQGMSQKLRDGIWPWKPPLGYLPPKAGKKRQADQPDPTRFEPIRKAWELLATGAYTKASILRLLRTWGVKGYRGQMLCAQRIDQIFRNPYYAGILMDPWTRAEYKGEHVPMVTPSEFARVQQVIASRGRSKPHHRIHPVLPLRGLVRCPSCELPMSGGLAKGKKRRYPYYNCFRRNCLTRTKSYPAGLVHANFSKLLMDASVPEGISRAVLKDLMAVAIEHREQSESGSRRRCDEIGNLKCQLQELISMRISRLITDAEFIRQKKGIQGHIFKLEGKIRTAQDDATLSEAEASSLVEGLSDLNSLWLEMPIDARRVFEETVLPTGFVYRRVRTPEYGLVIRTVHASCRQESSVAADKTEFLNTLFSEIRRFLVIIARRQPAEKTAA